ncbi:MAG: FAD:protein FMN transferase [Coriobacteriia bacterium]|nr:FAD:protein FMN transferase [Coriobacteriia bacterium]MBN2823208.1 FAD:protein FMN transferase [Coriobacteriia bacterium]
MRRSVAGVCALLAVLASLWGCSSTTEPTVSSRATLGTAVTISAYTDTGDARDAIDAAFLAMDSVSGELDAYSSGTAVAVFNRDPYTAQELSERAVSVLAAISRLGVKESFSPALLGVSSLYGFESSETVPSDAALAAGVRVAHSLVANNDSAVFTAKAEAGEPLPGLDFGGAAKGLGLDEAAAQLQLAGMEGAIVSAGSTTVAIGEKPDEEPWRIGIEDPRDEQKVVAVVESVTACAVSTSGDYQRYFESGGVRYHHILDPSTGAPARGLRSLTVFGPLDALSGLDADILSTALFVMGAEKAESYALAHSLGLYMVDDEGRALVVPAPEDCGVDLVER